MLVYAVFCFIPEGLLNVLDNYPVGLADLYTEIEVHSMNYYHANSFTGDLGRTCLPFQTFLSCLS